MDDEQGKPPGSKRAGTVYGPRNEDHGRRVPTPPAGAEILPPRRQKRASTFDFEAGTPPTMDPATFHAIEKLRDEMLAADTDHGRRIGAVESGLGKLSASHEGMAGEFRTLTTTIIQDRNDEREQRKAREAADRAVAKAKSDAELLEMQARANHRRSIVSKIVGGLFSVGVLTTLIALIARGC